MQSYVAGANRTKQSVTHGMDQHIAIGVRLQAVLVLNANAPQHHMVTGTKAMNVIAVTDTHTHAVYSTAGLSGCDR
jgi:hypothetical protein